MSFFIIPNRSLCNKLNKLALPDDELNMMKFAREPEPENSSVLISLPIDICDTMKYKRGSFEFNVCFMLSKKREGLFGHQQENEDTDDFCNQIVDEEVITRALYKLQSHLIEMELESDFLSCTPADAQPKSDETCQVKLKKKSEMLEWIM